MIQNNRTSIGRKLRQNVNRRGDKFVSAVEFTNKNEITPMEVKHMGDFTKTPDSTLSIEGIALKNRILLAVIFYKSLSSSAAASRVTTPSGYIPGVDSFLDSFINHYMNNPEFKDSLVVNLTKAYVSKVDGVKNPKYGAKVLNFFLALYASGDKKAFEFVSGNLCGIGLRWMKKLCSRKRGEPFIVLSKEQMVACIVAHVMKIRTGFKDPTK